MVFQCFTSSLNGVGENKGESADGLALNKLIQHFLFFVIATITVREHPSKDSLDGTEIIGLRIAHSGALALGFVLILNGKVTGALVTALLSNKFSAYHEYYAVGCGWESKRNESHHDK